VVPIVCTEPDEYTLEKLQGLNGVFFPGGDGDYNEKVTYVYNKVKEFND